MSERAFMIYECGLKDLPETAFITESELKRRLSAILVDCGKLLTKILVDVPPSDIMDSWIDILLHGEGKEEPRIKDQLVRLNGTDNPEPVYPDPWEEWVERMPQWFSIILSYGKMEHPTAIRELKDWLRKMPRGK